MLGIMKSQMGRVGVTAALALSLLVGISSPVAHAIATIATLSPGAFTWIGSKSATLGVSPAGWTQIVTYSHDDEYQEYNLGFNVIFEGVSYNSIQIHSNTYITFLNNGVTAGVDDTLKFSDYNALTPSLPAKPGIHMCSKDNSYQRVYVRYENTNTQFRIRYEGSSGTSGTVGTPGIVYEAVLSKDSSVIDIGMGINASCDSNSGMAGITTGTDNVMEAQFPNLIVAANGYSVTTGANFKNNDYRISAGPVVSSFSTSVATPTNTASSILYTLTLNESVTGIAAGDFTNVGTATGCTFTPSASSGITVTVTINGCGEGTLIPQLAANSVSGTSLSGPATNSNGRTTVIDRTAPTISSVSATNGNYNAALNSNLNLTVAFNESVTVTGTPRIALTIGTSTEFANFISLTDSRTATFRFTVIVEYGDIDLDGIVVNSPLQLNSGAISDLATNSIVSLTFTPPVTTSVNVYQPPSAPIIESITANNGSVTVYFTAPTSNGSVISNYKYSLNSGSYLALSPLDATSPVTISGLTNGTAYQIAIKAVSNLGDGLASNSVSSTPSSSASVTISLTASATTATKGTTIVITASVSQAGVVTFFWNAKRISGCITRPVTSTATCNWKPAVTGNWTINALLDPTDPTYVNSSSNPLSVFITSRSNTR
jgi:hypothetical protein